MKRNLKLAGVLTAVLAIVGVTAFAVYKGSRPPADMPMVQWYPEDTLAYLTLTNASLTREQMEGLDVYKAWRDVTGETPWDSMDRLVRAKSPEGADFCARVRERLQMFEGAVSLGILGRDEATKHPVWLLTADISNREADWQAFWNSDIKTHLNKGNATVTPAQFAGASYEKVAFADGFAFAAGVKDGILFISTQENALQGALERVASKKNSLMNQERFGAMVARMEHGDGLFAYLDVARVRQQMPEAWLAKGGDRVLRILGLDGVEALAASSRIENGVFVDRVDLAAADGKGNGVVQMALSRKPSKLRSVDAFPDQADFLYVGSFADPDQLYRDLKVMLEKELPKDQYDKGMAAIATLEEYLRMGLEQDILANLGNEAFVALLQGGENEAPRAVMGIEVRDEPMFTSLVESQLAVLALLDVTVTQTSENGVTRFDVQAPDNVLKGVHPQLAVGHSYLFIATDAAYLDQSLQALEGGETRNPLYLSVKSQLPDKMNGFAVNRTGQWAFLPKIFCCEGKHEGTGCAMKNHQDLENLSKVIERLPPTALAYRNTGDGFTVSSSGPMPSVVLLGAVAAMVAAPSAVPAAPAAEVAAGLTPSSLEQTLYTLGGLSAAAETYYLDHKSWPAAMDQLPAVVVKQSGTRDGWGQEVTYELSASGYRFLSPGGDGKAGTPDDVQVVNGSNLYDPTLYPAVAVRRTQEERQGGLQALWDGFLRKPTARHGFLPQAVSRLF